MPARAPFVVYRLAVLDSPFAVIALVVVLVLVVSVLIGRREESARRGAALSRAAKARRAKRIAAVLMAGAVILIAVGFTQFRILQEAQASGTVVLAIDVSESMSRTDIVPNRLEAAKEAARVFLDRLPSELQVGLVAFAAEADVVVAPTAGRTEVVAALDDLPRGEGTAVGGGLDASLDAVEATPIEAEDAAAAVVLLSDGRDCELAASQCPPSGVGSVVPSADAASRAAEIGVQVHTVLLGPATETDTANIEFLRQIAETTGGSAYTAETASGLIDVYQTLESQISTELAISDFGALFIVVAAALAIAATIAILIAIRSDY
jgi:Ca-activated chloride channel family protein